MKLLRPSIEYKQQVLEYKNEFMLNGYNLAGTSYLQNYDVYEEWMKFVSDNELLTQQYWTEL
jgi:predicted acetyltransferase